LNGNDVTGVDFPALILKAKKRYPQIKYISFDLSDEFPIVSESFDVVYANQIVEHIIDDGKFLEECFRILKPGGILVLSTPNIAFIRDRIWLLLGIFASNTSDFYNHINHYTFKALKRKLIEANFKNICLKGAVYNLGSGFIKDFFRHFKYCYQNPLWFLLESILPRNFKSMIVARAMK
jgi:2-polyprenyl-3-methyl-5-hydroxy-6-metoxy-1,4-benzoquinol methylase